MADRPHKRKKKTASQRSHRGSGSGVGVRRASSGQGWILVHPRCVRDRSEDLEEVQAMIAAGEADIAIDELRWLLGGCSEMIAAHFLLGKLAVEVDGDVPLARGHFGFGYEVGLRALRREKMPAPLSAEHPANRPFFDAGRGLAWCLNELGKSPMALEVLEQLVRCDPSDPLGLKRWIDEIQTGGADLVDLHVLWKH